MFMIRPHHAVCLTKLYDAIQLYSEDKEKYFNAVKEQLRKEKVVRNDLLDSCKHTWGIIYSEEVMERLSNIIKDGVVQFKAMETDSICEMCAGNIDGRCTGEDLIQVMDEVAKKTLNVRENDIIDVECYVGTDNLEEVCSLCKTKFKCDRIRRAIENLYKEKNEEIA